MNRDIKRDLYSIKRRKRNIIAFALPFAVGIFMCTRIRCSTGIACICVTVLLILGRRIVVRIKDNYALISDYSGAAYEYLQLNRPMGGCGSYAKWRI